MALHFTGRTLTINVALSLVPIPSSGACPISLCQTAPRRRTAAANANVNATSEQVAGSGTRELIAHVYGAGGLTIDSVIQNNSNTTGLTKAGTGTLTLGGTSANTYTGTTTVNDGTLILNKSANTTAVALALLTSSGFPSSPST